jgi:hypothetical protein
MKKISRRLVFFLTAAAAALLVFCFLDMNHKVQPLTTAQLKDLITQTPAANLNIGLHQYHARSVWGESSAIISSFSIMTLKDGKITAYYTSPLSDDVLALLGQKNLPCPVYVQGRDFEVLGAPGRFLPFLGGFILALGGIYLLKRLKGTSAK